MALYGKFLDTVSPVVLDNYGRPRDVQVFHPAPDGALKVEVAPGVWRSVYALTQTDNWQEGLQDVIPGRLAGGGDSVYRGLWVTGITQGGPENLTPPYITGDLVQGGELVFHPGDWLDAVTFRYRVLRGTVAAPNVPAEVLLDWTTNTATPVTGINDGDYLWLQEEATGPGGTAVATAFAGFGPMVALAPADATIIGAGGLSATSVLAATTYTFPIDIADVPARGFVLELHMQGAAEVTPPTWSAVTIAGIPLTKIYSTTFADSTRVTWSEVWVLWGPTVPVGAGLVVSATRSATAASARSNMAAIAVGNTSAAAPTAANVSYRTNPADLSAYSWNDLATTLPKRLVLAFCQGQFLSTGGAPVFTPGTGWTTQVPPWPGARAAGSLAWQAVMSKTFAAVTDPFTVDYTITDTGAQRYGMALVLQLQGDNS